MRLVKDEKNFSNDESEWIKAERVSRNLPTEVEFYVPESLHPENQYILILRTKYGNGTELKIMKQAIYDKSISLTTTV